MGVSDFEARAQKALQLVGKLSQSIAELKPAAGHFKKSLTASGGSQDNLTAIGRPRALGLDRCRRAPHPAAGTASRSRQDQG